MEYKIINSTDKVNELLLLPENEDLEKRLSYFHFSLQSYVKSIAIASKDTIIGMLAYNPNYEEENCIHLEFITVDPKYQGQGLSSKLLETFILMAKEQNLKVSIGRLTSDGKTKIKKKAQELSKKYSVELSFSHWRDQKDED